MSSVSDYEGKKLIDYVNGRGVKTPVIFVDNPVYYKLAESWLSIYCVYDAWQSTIFATCTTLLSKGGKSI